MSPHAEDLSPPSPSRSGLERPPASSHLPRAILLVALAVALIFLVRAGGPSEAENETDYNPQLFPEVARNLLTYYLDPDRITPRELMEKTFSTLETSVDEVYVENSDPSDPWVRVHVDSRAEVFNLNELTNSKEHLDDAVAMLASVFSFLREHYSGPMPLSDVQYAVLNGFLGGLDPHTLVFSPKAFEEFFVHIEGEIFGVGMYVGNRDGKLQVIEVLKDNGENEPTPAQRAGFRKGDIITRIGDESTINMTVTEAVEKIRGPRHSKVTLTVKRESKEDATKLVTLPIEVERDRVVIKSVDSKLITDWDPAGEGKWSGGVGYAKVVNFDKNTTRKLKEDLARLERENGGKPLAGLILDLRGNSGGLLTQAVEMCDLFLSSGTIVGIATRGRVERRTEAEDDGQEPAYPIVALADEASASGAEIVLGALQKNNRALILGTSTFGKGSVQQLFRLSNEAQLKVTVSEYLLPQDISIQENGVVPDILARPVTFEEYRSAPPGGAAEATPLVPPPDDVESPMPITMPRGEFDLFPDERRGTERDYEKHIVSRFAKEEFPAYTLDYFLEPVEEDPDSDSFIRGDLQPEKDKLVATALRLLRLADRPFRSQDVLAAKKDAIEKLKDDLFREIVERVAKKDIDWSDGPPAEKPALDLKLTTAFETEAPADTEDPVPVNTVVITAEVTNTGSEALSRVKGITRSDYYLYRDREFLFGKIAPGATVERSVRIPLPYFPHARSDVLRLEASGDDGKVITSAQLTVELEDKGRPRFSYTARLVTEGGDTIDSVEAGVEALLRVTLRNTGDAPAHKGVAILRNETGRQVFLKNGRIEFTNLLPGAETEVEFQFEVRKGDPVVQYDFELGIVDSYSGASLTRTLAIPHRGKDAVPPFPNGVSFTQPAIEARVKDPKTGEPILVTGHPEARVESLIRSPSGTPFKAWVVTTLLNDHTSPPDKVFFSDSRGKDEMKLACGVPLKKGINLVTLHVKDQNGLESRANLFVRREAVDP